MTAERHIQQAEHNWEVSQALSGRGEEAPVSSQWALTCIFYAALHYVSARLWNAGVHPPAGHAERESRLATLDRAIYRDYTWLKTQCDAARYNFVHPTGPILTASQTRLNRIREFATET